MKHIRIRGETFIQSLPENSLKKTKMVIVICKFSKIFQKSMAPDPVEPFLFLNLLQINSDEKEYTQKMSKYVVLSPKKKKMLNTSLT